MENKQLDEALATAIKKGVEVAEKTGNFVIEQAPDLLKEFYAWQLWSNIALAISMTVMCFIIFFAAKKISKEIDEDFLYILYLFQLIPLVFLATSIYKIIFISVAPKLYLIEYFIK